ncbi:MAG: hypothetical protein PHF35_01725 [Candidatus Moranbacteria bacterium]|nr:hypothetical protein [Candidatus Moranbacteria bacterium]
MKKIIYWFSVVVVGIALGLALQFARAWTEPVATPPGGNLGAPINTGGTTQTKSGDICTTYGGTTKCLSSSGGGSPSVSMCVCRLVYSYVSCGNGWYTEVQKNCGEGWESAMTFGFASNEFPNCAWQNSNIYFPCDDDISHISSDFLYEGDHNASACTDEGGVVEVLDGERVCHFTYSSPKSGCPSGWTRYGDWSATSSDSVSCSSCTSCTVTGSHSWGDTPVESCEYSVPTISGSGISCSWGSWATTTTLCLKKLTEAACY